MNPLAVFRILKAIVARRRGNVLAYMPQFAPYASRQIVDDMLTPGTMAHALMLAICLVIAEELAFRDYQSRLQDADSDWMG
jgi:hypothetical protein